MPGCVLRAASADFRVDDFLQTTSLVPCDVYHKGEPRGLGGRLRERSGLTILVSDADGNNLRQQVRDAIEFLERNRAEVSRLQSYIAPKEAILDFGVWKTDNFGQFCYLPPALLRLAGSLGLGIEVSIYAAPGD